MAIKCMVFLNDSIHCYTHNNTLDRGEKEEFIEKLPMDFNKKYFPIEGNILIYQTSKCLSISQGI